jgi:hypothetical protein
MLKSFYIVTVIKTATKEYKYFLILFSLKKARCLILQAHFFGLNTQFNLKTQVNVYKDYFLKLCFQNIHSVLQFPCSVFHQSCVTASPNV